MTPMTRVRLILLALNEASAMGIHMAGAEMAGGDVRRRRAMSHKRLFHETLDALTAPRGAGEPPPSSLEQRNA